VLWGDEADRAYLLREGTRLDEGAVTSVLQRSWMLSMDREVTLIAGRSKVRKS
jgi:hypothetical protein